MTHPWELPLDTTPPAGEARFLGIARAVAQAIRDGRLRAGDALPGSRALAASLGVNRNTVLAALHELSAEGWVVTAPARGTFVAGEIPEPRPRALRGLRAAASLPERAGFELRGARPSAEGERHVRGGVLPASAAAYPLLGGVPDLRFVPVAELGRAYRRALRGRPSPLAYGDARGEPRLRAALALMLAQRRGVPATERDVVVTRGSQMALYLAARAILSPGDVVAVEALGYRPAWEALRLAGARLVALPVDAHGVSVEALRDLCARERVRAVYVTPHHQYPTTVLLSPARRLALLDLARRQKVAVLEDDYDHEFHFDGRPALPLASADTAGVVVYVGTLSKILAPGLRVGFVCGPAALLDRVALLRTFVDRQGDRAVERAVAELLEDGVVQRYARRMRKAYAGRRDALVTALHRHLGERVDFRVPQGGMAVWVRAPGVDVDAWQARAAEHGVLVHTGRRFTFDGRATPCLRVGFAPLDEEAIGRAVALLARAAPRRSVQTTRKRV